MELKGINVKRTLDKPQLVYGTLAALAMVFMNMVEVKPNRISSGVKMNAVEFLGIEVYALILLALVIIGLSFSSYKRKSLITAGAGALLFVGLAFFLGRVGLEATSGDSSMRITLSSGFYVLLLSIYLIFGNILGRDRTNGKLIKSIAIISFGLFVAMLFLGNFDSFSIIKEYQIKQDQFVQNFRTHLFLALGSVLAGALIAMPLGYLAYRKSKYERAVMVPLSILETIPSLSLFGILLIPLGNLGKIGFFESLGVSGIGWAPAFVALTLYTLLPIGRNTLVGFSSVDNNIIEAAQGMGMNKKEVFSKVLLPLALPIILTGIRIATIQALGGAVVAGLVGGGGLGSFVFLGLGEASPDLVLLGVIPIVFMTLISDNILKSIISRIRREKP